MLKETIPQDTIQSNDSILEFQSNQLSLISKSTIENVVSYNISGTTLRSSQITAYAAAVHFYIGHNDIANSSSSIINSEEIIYKKAFRNTGITGLISFFYCC
ncbi:hypothetical protein [Flavobacterium sp. 3HN19-14]|uniref:hypothetical protein n=1 Tax=Flavobacterium sp. 3HN19-14 TaxID=3448133 RepID=UPI003EE0C1E6